MDSGVGRVFMVAGAGFEPATFSLEPDIFGFQPNSTRRIAN